MEVKLKRDWFYHVDAGPANDRRAISGGRYRKGTHTMPDELRSSLPRDAEVLDDKPVVIDALLGVEIVPDLVDEDLDRAAAEAAGVATAEAEATRSRNATITQKQVNEVARQATIKQNRLKSLSKARDAKAAKKQAEKDK